MIQPQPDAPLVHSYDVEHRVIRCGAHDENARSTKHRSGVTCPVCLQLLSEEPAVVGSAGSAHP